MPLPLRTSLALVPRSWLHADWRWGASLYCTLRAGGWTIDSQFPDADWLNWWTEEDTMPLQLAIYLIRRWVAGMTEWMGESA